MFALKIKDVENFLMICSILAYAIEVNIASVLILLLTGLFLVEFVQKPKLTKAWDDGVWIFFIAIFPAILNVLRTHEYHTYLIIGYFMTTIAYVEYKNNALGELFNKLKIVSLIEAVSIYIQYLMPEIYNTIVKFLLPTIYEAIKIRYEAGYCTGLTKEVSFTVWFIVIGFACYFADFYVKKKKENLLVLFFLGTSLLISGKKAQPLFILISLLLVYVIISNKQLRIIKFLVGIIISVIVLYLSFPIWGNWSFMQRYITLINNIVINSNNIHEITTGRIEIYYNAIELWKTNKIKQPCSHGCFLL